MIRTLDVAATPAFAAARPPAGTVVVIDVLRATSTIVAAFDNGACGNQDWRRHRPNVDCGL